MTGLIIVLVIIIVLILFVVSIYNKLVSLKLNTESAWAQIDTHLKRRFDLIPNLVETVKAYSKHESETFERVIEARNKYVSGNGSVEEASEADNVIKSTMKDLFALAESYPELKANENFKELQIELTGTEDKIAYARQAYNNAVQMYNQTIMIFPNNLVVSIFGKGKFEVKSFFEVAEEEKKNVKVSF